MKRHEALIPLTHDHHHALAHVRRLRMAAGGSDEDRLKQASAFLAFFNDDTISHFREEEEVVFPLIAYASEAEGTLEHALMDHRHIRALVQVLQAEVDAGCILEATMRWIADRLERHIRFEEKVVFPLIETIVGRSELVDLALHPRDRVAV